MRMLLWIPTPDDFWVESAWMAAPWWLYIIAYLGMLAMAYLIVRIVFDFSYRSMEVKQ